MKIASWILSLSILQRICIHIQIGGGNVIMVIIGDYFCLMISWFVVVVSSHIIPTVVIAGTILISFITVVMHNRHGMVSSIIALIPFDVFVLFPSLKITLIERSPIIFVSLKICVSHHCKTIWSFNWIRFFSK